MKKIDMEMGFRATILSTFDPVNYLEQKFSSKITKRPDFIVDASFAQNCDLRPNNR
jgi:hypothetical protein